MNKFENKKADKIAFVDNFYREMGKVIELIKKDLQKEAQSYFNKNIHPKYIKDIWTNEEPLNTLRFFFLQLDEYLNNESARVSGLAQKEDLIGSYYSSFKEDIQKTKEEVLKLAIRRFVEENNNNPYVRKTLGKTKIDELCLKNLVDSAFQDVPKEATCVFKNETLASFFFMLSEIDVLPKNIRDFVLDVSIYCEGAGEYSQYYKSLNLVEKYEGVFATTPPSSH